MLVVLVSAVELFLLNFLLEMFTSICTIPWRNSNFKKWILGCFFAENTPEHVFSGKSGYKAKYLFTSLTVTDIFPISAGKSQRALIYHHLFFDCDLRLLLSVFLPQNIEVRAVFFLLFRWLFFSSLSVAWHPGLETASILFRPN